MDNEKVECDECDNVSGVNYVDGMEEEQYEALQAEGWIREEGTIFCDECQSRLRCSNYQEGIRQ